MICCVQRLPLLSLLVTLPVERSVVLPHVNPSQTYLKFPVSLLEHLLRWVAEDSGDATGVAIGIDEGWAVNAILALPFDGEGGIGFLQVDRLGVSAPGQLGCKMVGGIEQPGIAGIGGE